MHLGISFYNASFMAAKVYSLPELIELTRTLRHYMTPIHFTNGCFDILHAGHVQLFRAMNRDPASLVVVAVNSDESVRKLKGPGRPINSASERCAVLAALADVDAVTIFDELRVTSLLRSIQPAIWFKGGDYAMRNLDKSEKEAVRRYGGKIQLVKPVAGLSTTSILARLDARSISSA